MKEPGFRGMKVPNFWVAPGSQEFQQGSRWGSGCWGDWQAPWGPRLKRWTERTFLQDVCQIPLHHSTGCFRWVFAGNEFLWFLMVEWCLVQEMHSVILHYLIPYDHQPENQELDPKKICYSQCISAYKWTWHSLQPCASWNWPFIHWSHWPTWQKLLKY